MAATTVERKLTAILGPAAVEPIIAALRKAGLT